jgi:hypothetical protein
MRRLVLILALIGCETKEKSPSSSPASESPSPVNPSLGRVTPCGDEVLGEEGIGSLQIGATVESVRQRCKVIRDTTVIAAEGMPARKLSVALSRDTVEAEIVNGRVWRIAIHSPRLRTADALGVGTLISRLRLLREPRGMTGEGKFFVASRDHCGMSFRISNAGPRAQRGDLDREGLFSLPATAVVSEVLIFGCRLSEAPSPGETSWESRESCCGRFALQPVAPGRV